MKRDLEGERRRLERAWETYLAVPGERSGVPVEERRVAHEIAQSWRRSRQVVTPSRRTAPVDDPSETLQEWRDSLLYAATKPLLEEIKTTAEEQDFVVGVCDATGKLLWTHSGHHMKRRAADLHFVPGGHWDERSVGTNALALALRQGQPREVFSAEHYLKAVHDWVCYSAPIRDPESGLALGVLDFSTTWQKHNPLGLLTATALARYVEARLAGLLDSKTRSKLGEPYLQTNSGQTSLGNLNPEALTLQLLGASQVWLGYTPLSLSPRRLEILALLALHPQGLDLDALHTHLYGDQAVSFSTLKAEVSGLRKQLSGALGSRPYRLLGTVAFDALEVQSRLQAGDLWGALRRYHGPLLQASESPCLREWGGYLEHAVVGAARRAGDPEALWQLVTHTPNESGCDPEVLLELLRKLPQSDPRAALVEARLKLIGFNELST